MLVSHLSLHDPAPAGFKGRVIWGYLPLRSDWQSTFHVAAHPHHLTCSSATHTHTHRSLVFCDHLRRFVSIAWSTTMGSAVCVFGWIRWIWSSRFAAYSPMSHRWYIIEDKIKSDKKNYTLEVSHEAEKATSGLKGNSAASWCLLSKGKCLILAGY